MVRSPEERPSQRHRRSGRFVSAARELGARVRQLRQEREWTLEGAAEKMDLDLKHLQKVESGTPPLNVTLVTLVRIAAAFDVPLDSLFHRGKPTTRRTPRTRR